MAKKITYKNTLIKDIQEQIKIIESSYGEINSTITHLTNRLKKQTEQAHIKRGEYQALKNVEKRLLNNKK